MRGVFTFSNVDDYSYFYVVSFQYDSEQNNSSIKAAHKYSRDTIWTFNEIVNWHAKQSEFGTSWPMIFYANGEASRREDNYLVFDAILTLPRTIDESEFNRNLESEPGSMQSHCFLFYEATWFKSLTYVQRCYRLPITT